MEHLYKVFKFKNVRVITKSLTKLCIPKNKLEFLPCSIRFFPNHPSLHLSIDFTILLYNNKFWYCVQSPLDVQSVPKAQSQLRARISCICVCL